MSLSKVMLNEDTFRRDSFDDRVCDDLCQLILKYLSIKERFKLECVSKQFQRTAFLSQLSNDFIIPHSGMRRKSLKQLEQLLIKCSTLSRITFGIVRPYRKKTFSYFDKIDFIVLEPIYNEVFEIIIKNCKNLTHIDFNRVQEFDEKLIEKFFDEFCNKIISLSTGGFAFNLFKAPNIEDLTVFNFYFQLSQIKFNKLKSLKVLYIQYEQELNGFEAFIENNAKTLKKFEITSNMNNKEIAIKLLKSMKKSINLVHLGFDLMNGITDNSLTKYWNQLSINCKQLKSLKSRLQYNERMRLNEIIPKFKAIKRLDLTLNALHDMDDQPFRTIKDLTNLKELTHLTLDVYTKNTFDETILTDIDINFPVLQSLKIKCPIIASEWTPKLLSRLKNLETIELNIKNYEVVPEIETKLIQNCRKFKRFNQIY